MLLDGAFTALLLLLLISGVSAVIVLPPTNVSVSCQNVKVTVSWEYSKKQPQTSFRVNISGSARNYVTETTDHQYDLSRFVWESEEHYMGFNYVSVTAIQGGILSEPVNSASFTFNKYKTADIRCELDFPPVDLDLKDSGPLVSFINPLHYYAELTQAKTDTATFKFNVFAAGKNFTKDCTVEQKNCSLDFSYLEGVEEKCVNLTGQLPIRNSVMLIRKIDHICPSNSTEVYWIVLIILLSVTVLIIIGVAIIICMTSAWTLTKTPLPKLLDDFPDFKAQTAIVSTTTFSSVIVDRPCRNPSVTSEEDHLQDGGASCGFRPPSCLYEEGAAGLLSDDSADDSERTECVSVHSEEEEEEEERPYDRPHVLQVDMGDGDMVTGYSQR